MIQNALSPRGRARRHSRTRLILCGSALTHMRGLLSASAPLRGRANTELMLHPSDFRDAAGLWGLTEQPDVALRVHALVGGTPAYLDFCARDAPDSADDVDPWVVRRLLSPASAMFREGRVLLSPRRPPSPARRRTTPCSPPSPAVAPDVGRSPVISAGAPAASTTP
ncbi:MULTISPECIES: hypothetical protein [Protofrankia]|uniref:hypothetical protein n=1 Tax=Protofrankia TaxID=2994361 RepID=UPI00190FF625|nr:MULTISPECIES: hypothetical protein [Protofrankia]